LKKHKKILIIVQRSNGDVFFSYSLIAYLKNFYENSKIDILVNSDTKPVANLFQNISNILEFSYKNYRQSPLSYTFSIIRKIFRSYDLSINLTSSDRSVLFCALSSRNSISVVENNNQKSWWKKILLKEYFFYNQNIHILEQTLFPLKILKIPYELNLLCPRTNKNNNLRVQNKLHSLGIKKFIIFHPCAQYSYKVYPKIARDRLLENLSKLEIPIVITGGKSSLDLKIKEEIQQLKNVHDFIGEISIEEYIELSRLAMCYVGMDTLNMHIAASQNKNSFIISGPTNMKIWAPWSNPISNNTSLNSKRSKVFQANMDCVPCGRAGCDDMHGLSECLYRIDPLLIFNEIKNFIDINKTESQK